MSEKLFCKWCGCALGSVQTQEHDNPDFAQYRECLKCGYQWAKQYWKECKEDYVKGWRGEEVEA